MKIKKNITRYSEIYGVYLEVNSEKSQPELHIKYEHSKSGKQKIAYKINNDESFTLKENSLFEKEVELPSTIWSQTQLFHIVKKIIDAIFPTNQIISMTETEYMLRTRGHLMILIKEPSHWSMYTFNSSVSAFRNGHVLPKVFDNLESVEDHYKSWRGISELVENTEIPAC